MKVALIGGTGAFGLTYQSGSTFSLPLFLGAQVDGKTEIGGKPIGAWVRAAWVHEFLTDRSVAAGFNVLPGTNLPAAFLTRAEASPVWVA